MSHLLRGKPEQREAIGPTAIELLENANYMHVSGASFTSTSLMRVHKQSCIGS